MSHHCQKWVMFTLGGLSLCGLNACTQDPPPPAPIKPLAPAVVYDTSRPSDNHVFEHAITAADFTQHVRILASDEFQGRAPGTLGERLTSGYLEDQFLRIGLVPAFADSFFQSVPTLEISPSEETQIQISVEANALQLKREKDYVIGSHQGVGEINIEASEIVFAGFGVNAPEFGWNDYADIEVKNKIVMVLVNDPGFETGEATLFRGKAMTYYGRWRYKFEEAARQGAAGVLIVHDTAGAGYDWDTVRNSWSGPEFALPMSEDPEPRLAIQGWLHEDQARALFSASKLDYAATRKAANQIGFKAFQLPATLSAKVKSGLRSIQSNNAVAMIKGALKPDEAIVYSAHWDHLGTDPKADAKDQVFNGAVDNATGVAALLEIAEQMQNAKTRPERSVIFLFTTLEESGLLGSQYYAKHPAIPLQKTLAAINIDAMPVSGRALDMTVIGYGQSDLQDTLAAAIKIQGRVIGEEHAPEKGYFFRSDHFNFAKLGVPALYARAGWNLREGGEAAGKAAADDQGAIRYHKGGDEYSSSWKLDGTIEDVQALHDVGAQLSLANTPWPLWKDGSEFKAAREKQ